jgi:hypothetical protein
MNSLLQCLSNTYELTSYFTSDRYLADVSPNNPLGSQKAKMAHMYAALMHAMWSGHFTALEPDSVKRAVGEKAPQFLGFNQQDSQEFMAFLLDLLLEDLCRVKAKPYVEQVDSNGKTDEEAAKLTWDGYLRRNASHILDVFGGQFKSRVSCDKPGCGNESLTFDPFTSVPVPIPSNELFRQRMLYVDSKGNAPIQFDFFYCRGASIPSVGELAQWMVDRIVELADLADAEEATASMVNSASRAASDAVPHDALSNSLSTVPLHRELAGVSPYAGQAASMFFASSETSLQEKMRLGYDAEQNGTGSSKPALTAAGSKSVPRLYRGAPIPLAHELAAITCGFANSDPRMVVPHWANISLALDFWSHERELIQKEMAEDSFYTFFHFPGYGGEIMKDASPCGPLGTELNGGNSWDAVCRRGFDLDGLLLHPNGGQHTASAKTRPRGSEGLIPIARRDALRWIGKPIGPRPGDMHLIWTRMSPFPNGDKFSPICYGRVVRREGQKAVFSVGLGFVAVPTVTNVPFKGSNNIERDQGLAAVVAAFENGSSPPASSGHSGLRVLNGEELVAFVQHQLGALLTDEGKKWSLRNTADKSMTLRYLTYPCGTYLSEFFIVVFILVFFRCLVHFLPSSSC